MVYIPHLNHPSLLQQIIDVPAESFLWPQMALHPLAKAASGTAKVDIISGGEGKSAEFTNGDLSLRFQRQDKGVGPFLHTQNFTLKLEKRLRPS